MRTAWVQAVVGTAAVLVAASPCTAIRIVTTRPVPCQLNLPVGTGMIAIEFDEAPSLPPDHAIRVAGTVSGLHRGTLAQYQNWLFYNITTGPFAPGEMVMVNLRQDLVSKSGSALAGGYFFSFMIRSRPAAASWENPLFFDTASIPYFIHGGDLNGDRVPDLAVPNEGTSDVSIFINQGGSSMFASHDEYGVGTRPSSIFGEDFDNDGDQDLATADILGGSLSVLRNMGDGVFARAVSYPAGFQTRQVHGGDLNGDNAVDLCVTSNGTDEVYVFFNDGRGNFDSSFTYDVAGGPFAIRTGDFDLDGHLDIGVALNSTGQLLVLRNDGTGTFSPRGPYVVGAGPWDLNGNDFDNDGDFDLVAALSTSSRFVLLENDGTGAFRARPATVTGSFPLAVFPADLDGDGDIDLTTSSFSSGSVGVFLNDGAAGLISDATLPAQQSASYTWAHDLDGDGDLDLSVVDELSNKLLVFLNGVPGPAVNVAPLVRATSLRLVVWPNPLQVGDEAVILVEGLAPTTSVTIAPSCVDVVRVDGRRVQCLHAGPYATFRWDGRDQLGSAVASGRYLLKTQLLGRPVTGSLHIVR